MSDGLPAMTPMTVLGGRGPLVETTRRATLTEVTDLALASVAARLGQEDNCKERLAAFLGGEVPEVERLFTGRQLSAFWTGPQQWMVAAPHNTHENIAPLLKEKLGAAASVTEQNDAWGIFELEGDVVPIMELLCPIDMRTFMTDSARRTTIDHMGCFVVRRGESRLQILCPRSSSGSLHHAVSTAMHAVAD